MYNLGYKYIHICDDRAVIVQDVDGAAVEDGDEGATSFTSERVGKPHQKDGAIQSETVLGHSFKQWHNRYPTILLHLYIFRRQKNTDREFRLRKLTRRIPSTKT